MFYKYCTCTAIKHTRVDASSCVFVWSNRVAVHIGILHCVRQLVTVSVKCRLSLAVFQVLFAENSVLLQLKTTLWRAISQPKLVKLQPGS